MPQLVSSSFVHRSAAEQKSSAESLAAAEQHQASFAQQQQSQQQGTGAVRTPTLTSHAGSVASCRRLFA